MDTNKIKHNCTSNLINEYKIRLELGLTETAHSRVADLRVTPLSLLQWPCLSAQMKGFLIKRNCKYTAGKYVEKPSCQ